MRIVTLEIGAREVVRIGLDAGSFFLLRTPYLGIEGLDAAALDRLRDAGADLSAVPGLEAALAPAAERYAAEKEALAALARREHSRSELEKKLARKEHPAWAVKDALDRLEEEGLLSEDRFAEWFVRSRLRSRPQGERALRQGLRLKGIGKEASARGVAESRESIVRGLDALVSRLRQAEAKKAEKKGLIGREAEMAVRAGLYRRLLSRGFSSADIHSALSKEAAKSPYPQEPDEST